MKGLGTVLVLLGIAVTAYFFVYYDVAIEVPIFGRIDQHARMNTRMIACVGGIAAAVVGAIMLVVSAQKERR